MISKHRTAVRAGSVVACAMIAALALGWLACRSARAGGPGKDEVTLNGYVKSVNAKSRQIIMLVGKYTYARSENDPHPVRASFSPRKPMTCTANRNAKYANVTSLTEVNPDDRVWCAGTRPKNRGVIRLSYIQVQRY